MPEFTVRYHFDPENFIEEIVEAKNLDEAASHTQQWLTEQFLRVKRDRDETVLIPCARILFCRILSAVLAGAGNNTADLTSIEGGLLSQQV